MVEFLFFLAPSVLYILVRRGSIGVSRARANVGWRWGNLQAAALSVILFPVLLGIGYGPDPRKVDTSGVSYAA